MKRDCLGNFAASLIGLLVAKEALAMDIETRVDKKTGKEYFCANARCSGNSSCMGAGNAACGSQNKCANTDQKRLTGWFWADNKEECEKGPGKWIPFKKEYSFAGGNKPPFDASVKPKASPKK